MLSEYEAMLHRHLTDAEDERDRYKAALERAHEQLSKFDYKGPKQLGRAMMTIEAALPRKLASPEREET